MASLDGTLHDLADIAWWLKGYIAASGGMDSNNFGDNHVRALSVAMTEIRRKIEYHDAIAKDKGIVPPPF